MPLPFKLAKKPSEEKLKTDVVKFEKEVSEFKELLKKNKSAERHGELRSGWYIAKAQLHDALSELRKMEKSKGGRRTQRRRRVPRTRRR